MQQKTILIAAIVLAMLGILWTSGHTVAHAASLSSASPQVRAEIDRLGSKDAATRANAAISLSEMGAAAKPALPMLVALLDDTEWVRTLRGQRKVGEIVADALKKLGKPAREAVFHALEKEMVYGGGVSLAAELDPQRTRTIVEKRLRSFDFTEADRKPGPYVANGYVAAGVEALGTLAGADVLDVVLLLLAHPGYRMDDISGGVGMDQVAKYASDPRAAQAVPMLLQAIREDINSSEAQRALVALRKPETVAPLCQIILDKREGGHARYIADALAKIGDKRAVGCLVETLITSTTLKTRDGGDAMRSFFRALETLTGEKFKSVDDVEDWWESNRERFPAADAL